jgi:hypothetical protein
MPSVRDNRHVADVEGTSVPMRCWKCEGTLRAERAIDMSVASRSSCTKNQRRYALFELSRAVLNRLLCVDRERAETEFGRRFWAFMSHVLPI